MDKLILIDGNNIIYRAFFAMPPLTNASGQQTNAVYGFTTMLLRLIDEHKPTHMMVAFDAGKETFRHTDYQDYKGGRQRPARTVRPISPAERAANGLGYSPI